MLPDRQNESTTLLRQVRESVGGGKADRWFGPQTSMELDGTTVRVTAATTYLLKFLQQQYGTLIEEKAETLAGAPVSVSWEVDDSLVVAGPQPGTASSNGKSVKSKPGPRSAATGSGANGRSGGYDLDHFVVGDCNRVSFNAAQMLAARPLGTTGAMVLFGPIGSGKTHLLEGIAATVRADRSARVMTMNGSTFGNLLKQAVSEHSTAGFRQRFATVDLLCLDDLDFFESKRSFQDELIQTIDRLEARGGTVIVTASLHPKMLTGLSDALISRLLSGPVCRIEKPSRSVRRSVAAARASFLEADLSSKAVRYAADHFTGSVREVIGAVNTLHAHAVSSGERVTLSTARSVLTSLERDAAKVVRIADIEAAVSKLFGLPPTEMRSARRSRTVSQPRQVAMYLSRKLTSGAYKEIGAHFGGRNHSTVMAAERNVAKMIKNHELLKIGFQEMPVDEVVARIEEQIRVG